MAQPMMPPADIPAEEAILAASIIHGEALDAAMEIVRPEHFSSGSCRKVFEAICKLREADDPVDYVSVAGWLNARGTLASIGVDDRTGMRWLVSLGDAVQTVDPNHIRAHAKTVRDHWVLRRVLETAQRVQAECYTRRSSSKGPIEDAGEYAAGVSSELASISEGSSRETLVTLFEATKKAFEQVKSAQAKQGITGTSSGLEAYDAVTGGFHPGDLVVVAGRPSMGKSAYAFGCGLAVAKQGIGFLGFSLEMPDDQVALRTVCINGNVSVYKARSKPSELTHDDWNGLVRGASANAKLPFWIDSKPGATVPEMRAGVRRVKRECAKRGVELKLVVVDYIQLARAPGIENREQQISQITRELKELAKSEGVTVMALSQLNRSVEIRSDKRPMQSDLRESGAIEQDADAIVFLYRDDYYDADSEVKGITEVILSKQRNGPTCTTHVGWDKKTVSFHNVTDKQAATLEEIKKRSQYKQGKRQ